jgi:hypothetical protein
MLREKGDDEDSYYPNLDSPPRSDVARKYKRMFRTFFVCAVVALLFGLGVIVITVLQVVFEPVWWTLYLRSLAFVRTLILFFMVLRMLCCQSIRIVDLYGSGEASQAGVAVRPVFSLWAWRALGPVDEYVGRYLPLVFDVGVLIARPDMPAVHALVRLAVGVLVLFEYYIAVWLIHKRGIWDNVEHNALRRPRHPRNVYKV